MLPKRPDETGDPLLDPTSLQRFLRAHHLPPLDRFGQHYLVDGDVLRNIVAAAETDSDLPVVEIGAGLGVLTRALARARELETGNSELGTPLVAVELDRRLIPVLRERTREFPSVRVVQADILRLDLASVLPTLSSKYPTPYDVVGNIPYNSTAPILQRFLARPPRPRRMTLLVDEAVASVIAAAPPAMSLRAVSVQVYAKPAVVGQRIPPSVFFPPPAVHSAILTLETRATPLVPETEERAFFRLVRAGFSQKRKTLKNALSATYRLRPLEAEARLRRAGLDPSSRAQTLSVAEWRRLLRVWETAREAP